MKFGNGVLQRMGRLVAAVLVLSLAPVPLIAEEILYPVRGVPIGSGVGADAGSEVLAGESLIDLGRRFLIRPRDWVVVQQINNISDPHRVPVGTVLRIPVSLLRKESRSAEVVAVSGDVRADGRALAAGSTVGEGAALATGNDGHMVLRLPDGSLLDLPARSSMRIEALKGYQSIDGFEVELDLEEGRLESRAKPQRGPGARYRVDTPTAVIGVRGTSFRVAAEAELSRAEVTTGRVDVAGQDGETAGLDAEFGMVIRPGTLPAPIPLLPPPSTSGLPDRVGGGPLHLPLPEMAGAHAWRAQVSRDVTDAPVLVDRRVTAGPITVAALADGRYRLTLRAIDHNGLEGLDSVHRFRVSRAAGSAPPFLSLPVDESVVATGDVTFSWARVPATARYRIQVAADPAFAAPLVDATVDGTTFSEAFPVGIYRWRVAGVRGDGEVGPWSDPNRFQVAETAAASDGPTKGLHARWIGGPDQRFEYQIADSPRFEPVEHGGFVDGPTLHLPRFRSGSWWVRVRAVEDGPVGSWSGAQKILVPAELPGWMLLVPLLGL